MTQPVANPLVVLRVESGGRAMLLNPDTGHVVITNAVGLAVWKRLDGRRTLEEIVIEVTGLFEDVPSSILEDMTAFVTQLSAEGFVGYEVA
jgi:hypothetical protein